MISPTHLVLLAFLILLALVVFGPKRLPELGQSVGKAIQEFKKASATTVDEVKSMATDVGAGPVAQQKPVEPGAQAASTESATPAPMSEIKGG